MHQPRPFYNFPKVYTKNANPPSPLGERGVKKNEKIVGKAIKGHYLHICITVHSGEPGIDRTSATALGAILRMLPSTTQVINSGL
jgi:hypothetical protein